MSNRLNLIGEKYGRLCVAGHLPNGVVVCVCDCGEMAFVKLGNLRNGHTKSCGCFQNESRHKSTVTHGESRNLKRSPELICWQGMKARCYQKSHNRYANYGGRGIKVCERWRNSFQNFLKDMGRKPTAEHSIERKNNDGDYKPSNCKWATASEQQINSRNCHFLTVNGVTRTTAEWERRMNYRSGLIRGRIYHGWTDDRAVLKFPRKKR